MLLVFLLFIRKSNAFLFNHYCFEEFLCFSDLYPSRIFDTKVQYFGIDTIQSLVEQIDDDLVINNAPLIRVHLSNFV